MERFSLIVVADETSPIRRFDVRKVMVRRALWVAGIVACVFVLGLVDYVRVRIDHVELEKLRVESAEQRAKIESFDETVADVQATLDRVREFERKVRTIANLPGSVATGGAGVVEVGPSDSGDLAVDRGEAEPVPTSKAPDPAAAARRAATKSTAGAADDRVSLLQNETRRLGFAASERQLSLEELVQQLEDKHQRLASSPAVWPTQGWLTSRFGTRISPFTGKRHFGLAHPGLAHIALRHAHLALHGQAALSRRHRHRRGLRHGRDRDGARQGEVRGPQGPPGQDRDRRPRLRRSHALRPQSGEPGKAG
jgi:hypothetical protein